MENSRKFKVGDRVIAYENQKGTVFRTYSGWNDVALIEFDREGSYGQSYLSYIDSNGFDFVEDKLNREAKEGECYWNTGLGELEHIRIRNTKFARAYYPHYKVIDENWLEVCDE